MNTNFYTKYICKVIIISILFVFSACKKEDKGDVVYYSNGSINGTINGNKTDQTAFNEQFFLNTYLDYLYNPGYQIIPAGYKFYICFYDANGSSVILEFILTSATDDTPDIINLVINYNRIFATNIFNFQMSSNVNNTVTLSDFSFDESTGRVKGKLIAIGSVNSTSNKATVEAMLDVTLKKYMY